MGGHLGVGVESYFRFFFFEHKKGLKIHTPSFADESDVFQRQHALTQALSKKRAVVYSVCSLEIAVGTVFRKRTFSSVYC